MRFVSITVIGLYWYLIPVQRRRTCIFVESCSCHVYNVIKDSGFLAGVKSFIRRYKQCRPGYTFFQTPDGEKWVILKDLSVVKRIETVV